MIKSPESSEKKAVNHHEKREVVEWDGEHCIYSEFHGRFFDDLSSVGDYIESFNMREDSTSAILEDDKAEPLTAYDLRLIPTKPIYLKKLDVSYWYDELPIVQDVIGIIPPNIQSAIDHLNRLIELEAPIARVPDNAKRIDL